MEPIPQTPDEEDAIAAGNAAAQVAGTDLDEEGVYFYKGDGPVTREGDDPVIAAPDICMPRGRGE